MHILIKKLLLLLGHSSFKYQMCGESTFRTNGFYFVYELTDTGEQKIASCSRWKATHVGGYGVCGVIAKIEDVYGISWKYRKHHGKYDKLAHKRGVTADKEKVEFLKSLPKLLTISQYDDILFESIMDFFHKPHYIPDFKHTPEPPARP